MFLWYTLTHKNTIMKISPFERLPFVNLENLDEDHEIFIDYDANGNPVRIRKVRRSYPWIAWLVGLILLLVFVLAAA